jgi:hypothetical protein
MTEENISVIGITIVFILVGAFAGSMVTGCLMANSYVEDLRNTLQANENDIILPFSSERKIYTENVWKEIEKYL